MRVESDAFNDGATIPKKYTEDGQNLSPPLRWTDAPAGAREFALVVDDPDAPTAQPWVHWLLYRIPADVTRLAEGIPRRENPPQPAHAMQGVNSFNQNNIGYRGPAPPKGHGVHHYHFKLYALERPLEIESGVTKDALLHAMDAAGILEEAELVGTYERR